VRVQIPWGIQTYKSKSTVISPQDIVNMYAEAEPETARNKVALFRTPGMTQFAVQASKNAVRGFGRLNSTVYCVIDDGFYSLSSAGVLTSLGTLNTAWGIVEITSSTSRLLVVDGSYGYWYTVAGGFEVITDTDFVASRSVTMQDGWFISVQNNGTGRFQITNTADWDALEFATAEAEPDALIKVVSDHREVWLFGERTTEIWYNTGDADFTFSRMQGAFIEQGIGAQHSAVKHDNSIIWLGDDGIIYLAAQYTPKRISTHAIEQDIRAMTTWSDAVGYTHTWEGHEFYVISFPTGKKTYAFDSSTGLWHRRAYWNAPNQEHVLGQVAIEAYGKTLLGDRQSGTIYYFDEVYSDNGSTIRWEIVSPPVQDDQRPGTASRLQVDFEAGTSLVTGQGKDSQVMLQISRDSGKTWGPEIWNGIGAIGEFDARTVWWRLGHYRKGIVFRIAGSDPIKVVQGGSFLSVTRGSDGD
jgi:hypothetical protein